MTDSQTSACLKKDQFWFVHKWWASSKNAGNLIVNIDATFIDTENMTIWSMAHHEQNKCIKLAVVSTTLIINYRLHFLKQINNTDMACIAV